MFNPSMMDPALVAFFKQAADAFRQTAEAEAQGRLDKALRARCGPERPMTPDHPAFINRARLYAAKAYAMAHIDGQTTWGAIVALLDECPSWPPPATATPDVWLFQAFVLGFLYGSELPPERHASIEAIIPMAATLASNPSALAQQLGITPDKLAEIANNPQFREWAAKFLGGGGPS